MIAAFFGFGCWFTDGNLFILAAVGVIWVVLANGRRPNRRCSRCRQVNREEAVYCAQCGKRLANA